MRDAGQSVIKFLEFSSISQKLETLSTPSGSLKENPMTATSPITIIPHGDQVVEKYDALAG
jgi:hypothetical protein